MRATLLLVCFSISLTGCAIGKDPAKSETNAREGRRYGIGCWNDPNMRLVEDSAGMAHEVGNFIPAGMPIEEAERIMERHGFLCHRETFANVDYLVCVQRRFVNLGMHGQWTIHIYPRNGVVANVQAAWDLAPTYDGRATIPWRQRLAEKNEKKLEEQQIDEAIRRGNAMKCAECETCEPVSSAQETTSCIHL